MQARSEWRVRLVALTLLIMTIAAGCGASDADEDGTERDVRAAYAAVGKEFRAGDERGVCSHMSRGAARHVGLLGHGTPTTCQRDIRKLLKWIDFKGAEPPTGQVTAVEVDGDKASVTTKVSSYASSELPFVVEDGRWKLDNFFNITGPIPADF